jgi:nucleotide-binding universal stress UspA family protein
MNPPSILCPIDFSEPSAGALRYAAAIASHFAARIVLLAVEDPLLTEAVDLGTGVVWSPHDCREELSTFAAKTFGNDSPILAMLDYEVSVGKPAPQILAAARDHSCDLIVISTHGLTGARKLFFGSTTERVLRETTKPVLITPPLDPGPIRLEELRQQVRRVLVPVDLSPASVHQAQIARGISEALSATPILVNVIEPLKTRLAARLHVVGVEADRRAVAEERLAEIMATMPQTLHPEALVAYGDPAEELAKVARDRQVGLVVMGLHGSPLLGPRMGSVTYRLLCLTRTLVLALPPQTRAVEAPGPVALHAES